MKTIYLGNIIVQLGVLEEFFHVHDASDDVGYLLYGVHVVQQAIKGQPWATSSRFPKITMCDIQIRELGNIHNHTIQCALPMNLFNEKIYIFVWFWLYFVGCATLFSFVVWTYTCLILCRQEPYVQARLEAIYCIPHAAEHKVGNISVYKSKVDKYLPDKKRVWKFVNSFLRRDGIFIVHMVAKNTSDLVAAELLYGIWEFYIDNEETKRERNFSLDKGKMCSADRIKVLRAQSCNETGKRERLLNNGQLDKQYEAGENP